MLKVIITIIFIYILIRLLIRLIFLLFGIFLTRSLKAKYQNSSKTGHQNHKEHNGQDIIDAEFKEINKK